MQCLTRQLAALATVTLSCVACTTGISEMTCPPLVEYDRAFQSRAAAELAAMPADAALAVMMADYSMTRGQIRAACRGRR